MPRLYLAGLATFLLILGCNSQNPSTPSSASNDGFSPGGIAQPAAPAPSSALPPDPDSNPAAVLAMRTSAYAQAADALLARRTGNAQSPGAAGSNQWIDPSALSLSIAPATRSQPTTGPAPQVDSAAPAANTVASIAPVRSVDAAMPPAIANSNLPPRQPSAAAPEDLDRQLQKQIKESPRDLCAQLDYQLLQLLRDEQVPQPAMIGMLSPDDREVAAAVIDCLANFRTAIRADANMLANRKIRPFIELADRLRARADLRIPTVALCTRVERFGTYEPVEPARFATGREHPTIIYCEIENFASQLNDKHLWETRLTQEAVLYTETGMVVWRDKVNPIADLSRNRRHDFYLVKQITLPAQLSINRYLLKVSIVDTLANRVAEATVPVEIVAQ